MLVNFCTAQFQPLLECFQMQLDGYHAQNLAKNFSQNNGFLADSLQRPPVDIYIRFPFNIDIKHIYLGPSLGHHRSTLIEFCVNHQRMEEKTSWLIDSSNKSNLINSRQLTFYRIAQILNEDETIQRIEIYDHDNEQTNSNTSKYRFSANTHLINCSSIKITIKRTWRVSSCALKYLQIWGSLSNSIPTEFKTKLQELLFPTPVQPSASNDSISSKVSEEIPSDFLDSLTSDLMLIPMLLPSGHLIDRTTLEKCIAEDTRWSRLPRDPFTLKSFTEVTQPVVAQQLKMRIDQFLSEHQNDPKYRQYGRILDAKQTISDRNLFSLKRKSDHDDSQSKRK
ncbi:hypothetical protein I4U23_002285 [Adineta vaga]|nr:hypothetical protein I4U23_002285 [Adineta vaga]